MTTFPVIAEVQIIPPNGKLEIDELVDPSGAPVTVLDIDAGFTFKGFVELPGFLTGRGIVRLSADEIGGKFDDTIGTAEFDVTGKTTPTDPPSVKYPWEITVTSPTLPDVSKMYQFAVVFVLETKEGGHTDIGGFVDLGAFLVV